MYRFRTQNRMKVNNNVQFRDKIKIMDNTETQ